MSKERRTGNDFFVSKPLAIWDVGSHVRLDKEREEVAALQVLLLDPICALLRQNARLLLLQKLHADPLHGGLGLIDVLDPWILCRIEMARISAVHGLDHGMSRMDCTHEDPFKPREEHTDDAQEVHGRGVLEDHAERAVKLVGRLLRVQGVELVAEARKADHVERHLTQTVNHVDARRTALRGDLGVPVIAELYRDASS